MSHSLRKQLDRWEKEGLLSHKKVNELKATLPQKNTNMLSFVATLGALFIGISSLFFIASNWEGMSKVLKLFFLFVGPPAFLVLGQIFRDRNHKAIGTAFFLTSFLLFGTAMALLGQLYHMDPNAKGLFFWWAIGTLPLIIWNQSVALSWAWSVVYITWAILALELGFKDWPSMIDTLLLGVKIIPLIGFAFYKKRLPYWISTAGLGILAWHFLLFAIFGPENYAEEQDIFIALPWWHMVLAIVYIVLSKKIQWDDLKSQKTFELLGSVVLLFFGLWVTTASYVENADLPMVMHYFLNAAYVALCVGSVYVADKKDISVLKSVGIVTLGIWIITRYYSWFWELLDSSIFFLIGGIVLLLLAYAITKKETLETQIHKYITPAKK